MGGRGELTVLSRGMLSAEVMEVPLFLYEFMMQRRVLLQIASKM